MAGTTAGPFQGDGGLVTASLDFDAFFPSLDIEKCADIVKETIENSDVNVECDTLELALFVAASHSAQEMEAAGLSDVFHKRRFKKGARPGMTCSAITGGAKVRSEDRSWIPPSEDPTPRQKMKLMGMMVSYCVKLAMSKHYYTFNGEIRRQSDGGATGNTLTMELARMFGLWWDKQYKKILEELQLKMMTYWRYVDENGNVTSSINPGKH